MTFHRQQWKIRINEQTLHHVFAVLLILTVALLFTPALSRPAQSNPTPFSTYPDYPKYDSVPMAFTLNCDLQRVKRVTTDTSRAVVPTAHAVTRYQSASHAAQPAARFTISLPLLAVPAKGFRQACQLLDRPPPSI